MAYRDLREYVSTLEREGEAIRVGQEVDWDKEAGAILRRSYELKAPAPLFEKVKGYPEGYRLFGGAAANYRRVALSLGLAADTPFQEIVEEIERRWREPLKPVLVKDGPCQEVVSLAPEASLFSLPAPMIHEGDGGRFLGTWHLVATKDLDSSWVNWGMYRLMLHDRLHMGTQMNAFQHIGIMFMRKYEPRNLEMEFAAAFGGDPVLTIAAVLDYGLGNSEVDLAGALRREPVQLVPCKTVDLAVPAEAEIVVEGKFLPGVRLDEGPFGEYTGYRTAPRAPRPVCRVTAITHRHDPILPMASLGIPVDDGHIVLTLSHSLAIQQHLRSMGFPFKGVFAVPETAGHMAVVSIEPNYSNMATQIACAIWSCKAGVFIPYVVVVDSDVDPTNMGQVLHAITTKCHPARGIRVMDHSVGHPLIPFLNQEERLWGQSANVVFDCTWPLDWPRETVVPPRMSFENVYSKEIKDKVLANWRNYGYKE